MDPMTAMVLLSAGKVGLDFLSGRSAASKQAEEVRMRENYRQSLYDMNEVALQASYNRNIRANMLSEGINLGRQASALAKANIGVAGTTVPAFGSIMAKTDFENQGYHLNFIAQAGKLGINRSASRKAKAAGSGDFTLGEGLNLLGNVVGEAATLLSANQSMGDS